jgi:hypothetical protein
MDPSVALLLKVATGVVGVALFVYVLYRLVLAGRRMGRTGTGGEILRDLEYHRA